MRFTALTLLLFTCAGVNVAHCQAVTSFQGAFQFPTPAPGWSYAWNSGGPIGDPANYSLLLPNASGSYTANGGNIPNPAPASFLSFGLTDGTAVGHPGDGTTQAGSGGIERYAIATFMTPAAGPVTLTDGFLQNTNPNSTGSTDGLNLKVFLNDEAVPRVSSSTAPGFGSSTTFAHDFGVLAAGSKIYVAVGSVDDDSFDGFELRYDIHYVPEPNVITLAGLCILLGWSTILGRAKRAHAAKLFA